MDVHIGKRPAVRLIVRFQLGRIGCSRILVELGIVESQYGLSTAIGLVKSAIGSVLLVGSYWVANKTSGYRVF